MKIRIYKKEESTVFNGAAFRYIVLTTKDGAVDCPVYSDDVPMDTRKLKRFIRQGFLV